MGQIVTNFDEFWAKYPGKKVAKPKCKLKYDKLSDDEHKKVMLAIQAQSRYRAAAAKQNEFVAEWCNTQTFINQQRWYDEIESHAELKEKVAVKKCHCGNELPCEKHFYPANDLGRQMLIDRWETLGKPKTQQECIEALRKHGCLNLLEFATRPAGKRGGNPTKMGDL